MNNWNMNNFERFHQLSFGVIGVSKYFVFQEMLSVKTLKYWSPYFYFDIGYIHFEIFWAIYIINELGWDFTKTNLHVNIS